MEAQTNDEIIREEIELLLEDIRKAYYASGKKVSGQFLEGLEAEYSKNSATIKGYVYMAGRGKTKNKGKAGEPTLKEQIEKWIVQKGIIIEEGLTVSSLAYLIARKIHREGTKREGWYKIYEEVITPARIDQIRQRVATFNVNRIITEITAELEILAKDV